MVILQLWVSFSLLIFTDPNFFKHIDPQLIRTYCSYDLNL